nr:glutathione S-transferase domain-containing protein [Legionella feeleii]
MAPCYYQTVLAAPLYRNRRPDEDVINEALAENFPPVAAYLEEQLCGKRYLVDEQFTIADIAITSIFLNMYQSGYPVEHAKCPHLSTYLRQNFQPPSFQSCIHDVNAELERARKLISYA